MLDSSFGSRGCEPTSEQEVLWGWGAEQMYRCQWENGKSDTQYLVQSVNKEPNRIQSPYQYSIDLTKFQKDSQNEKFCEFIFNWNINPKVIINSGDVGMHAGIML